MMGEDAPADASAEAIDALQAALAELGVVCRVEPRGRLALLRIDGPLSVLADPALRRRVATLAGAHGFTHVALELDSFQDDRASLRRP